MEHWLTITVTLDTEYQDSDFTQAVTEMEYYVYVEQGDGGFGGSNTAPYIEDEIYPAIAIIGLTSYYTIPYVIDDQGDEYGISYYVDDW